MKKQWPFYLLVLSLFIVLISPIWLADGMFLDGMLYAAVSRNMAEGLGSFWVPYYTANWNGFYEHPPLALGLESIFFRLLGDTIYTERIYSFSTFIITGYIIAKIWEQLTGSMREGWLPLLLWIIIPTVFWAAPNNMLENTMMIFTSLAILFYLKRPKGFYFLFFSGLCVFLAFLSKGVFSLFVWSLPFWWWIFNDRKGWLRMITDTAVLVLFTVLPYFVIAFFDPGITNNLQTYLTNQVLGSIQNVQTVDSRFSILKKMISDLLPPLILAILVLTIALRMKATSAKSLFIYRNKILVFIALALSGVLPIMISLKQSSFYILATFPIFTLGIALCMLPSIQSYIGSLSEKNYRYVKFLALAGFIMAGLLAGLSVNKFGRDKEELQDVYTIIKIISPRSAVSIMPELATTWLVYAEFERYGKITIEISTNNEYLISTKGYAEIPEEYDRVALETRVYDLYQKIIPRNP
jgi:hypothetical protein